MNKLLTNIVLVILLLIPILTFIIIQALPSPIVSKIIDRNVLCTSVGNPHSSRWSKCYPIDRLVYSTPAEYFSPLENRQIPEDISATRILIRLTTLVPLITGLICYAGAYLIWRRNKAHGYRYINLSQEDKDKVSIKQVIIIIVIMGLISLITLLF